MTGRIPVALLAAAAISGAVAALGQPRPAIGALLSFAAMWAAAGRRLALIACVVAALGLIAAAPPRHPSSSHQPTRDQRR